MTDACPTCERTLLCDDPWHDPDTGPRPDARAKVTSWALAALRDTGSRPPSDDGGPRPDSGIDDVIASLTSEDEIAHGEAWDDVRKVGLGSCAYCDDEWPCRTQRGIDALLARLSTPRTETSDG